MGTADSAGARKGVPLGVILAGMVAVQALVVWVFAGVLFPGLV